LTEKATKIGGLLGVPVRAISVATKTRNAAQVLPTMATFGALGVVYGDIGTSPLYALREATKAASGEGVPTPEAVLGTVSLITWSLIVIISLKYAVLMLRADNRGEGGIVALLAVLRVRRARPRDGTRS
jgi:KUP system potassium uptake protein